MSAHGLWLLVEGRELFAPFDAFPWFRDASIAEVLRVEFTAPDHLHWPDLDVDLSVESVEHPVRFPLVSRGPRRPRRTRAGGSPRPVRPDRASTARSATR